MFLPECFRVFFLVFFFVLIVRPRKCLEISLASLHARELLERNERLAHCRNEETLSIGWTFWFLVLTIVASSVATWNGLSTRPSPVKFPVLWSITTSTVLASLGSSSVMPVSFIVADSSLSFSSVWWIRSASGTIDATVSLTTALRGWASTLNPTLRYVLFHFYSHLPCRSHFVFVLLHLQRLLS